MKPNPDKLQQIRERGFAVVEGVLDPAETPGLKALLQQCIHEDLRQEWAKENYIDSWMVLNLMTRGIPFARLLENPILHSYYSDLLGDTCIIYAYTSSSMPPNSTNYSHRIHVDCPRLIPGYITNVGTMIALDDYTAANGATYFLPGSHVRDTAPTTEEFFAKAERVFPKAGDAVIFNARTWHMGGKNETDQPRHALTMNLCRSFMRQRFDYPRMMPPHILETLGPVGRRFLGFNVRMPASLEEYYVPEERRLYKSGQG